MIAIPTRLFDSSYDNIPTHLTVVEYVCGFDGTSMVVLPNGENKGVQDSDIFTIFQDKHTVKKTDD